MLRRTIIAIASALSLVVLIGCGAGSDTSGDVPPIIIVPGLGMSALHVVVDRGDSAPVQFDFLVPAMNPAELLPAKATNALDYAIASGLSPSDADRVSGWLSLQVGPRGRIHGSRGVTVTPVSVGRNFGAECPRYVPMANKLASRGWAANTNVYCLPYDYRVPPGENEFVSDFRALIDRVTATAGGTPAVVACHSQGCLMAYHAMRVSDPAWLRTHVQLLYGLAGQFSGCSDCLRWAFQKGWSWDAADPTASPVDPSWAGELALGLQQGVYGNNVVFRNGPREYRARDAGRLLNDAGAIAMERATRRYALDLQPWFRKGSVSHDPLGVASHFVYGDSLPTTVGYAFAPVPTRAPTCLSPACAGFINQTNPDPITSDGDAGDSGWMNEAPRAWTRDASCDMRALPGVNHMAIITDDTALDLLVRSIADLQAGSRACVDGEASDQRSATR